MVCTLMKHDIIHLQILMPILIFNWQKMHIDQRSHPCEHSLNFRKIISFVYSLVCDHVVDDLAADASSMECRSWVFRVQECFDNLGSKFEQRGLKVRYLRMYHENRLRVLIIELAKVPLFLCSLHPFRNPWHLISWKRLFCWNFMDIFEFWNGSVSILHDIIQKGISTVLVWIAQRWLRIRLLFGTTVSVFQINFLWS